VVFFFFYFFLLDGQLAAGLIIHRFGLKIGFVIPALIRLIEFKVEMPLFIR